MINELKELRGSFSSQKALLAYGVAVFLFAAYLWIYQYVPFGDPFDNLALNTITSLAALGGAVISTAIFRTYHPDDQPRNVWKYMMLGAWAWFAAELTWLLYAYRYQEVPAPSFADIGWVAGFVFFTFALYRQYSIVHPARVETTRLYAIGAWILVLLLPLLLLTFLDAFSLETYVDFYYPFADLGLGLAGLMLVFTFRGGALMRSWIGLMIFGISDLLYAWAERSGLYTWSVDNGSLLTLFIDASYLFAYLILAIGFLGHWMLLTRGLKSK